MEGIELLDELPEGLMLVDDEGKLLAVNAAAARILGRDREELSGSFAFDLLAPSAIPLFLELLRKDPSDHTERTELSFRSEDGPVGCTAAVSRRSDGSLFIGFLEKELSERKGDLPEELLEDLPFPVIVLDRGLRPVFRNSATDERISLASGGKDPAEHPGKGLRNLLERALSAGEGGMTEVNVSQGDDKSRFEVIVTPLGRERVMEIWTEVPKEEGPGNADVPGRVWNELVDSSNAVIIGIDPDGRIELFNRGARRVLGYGHEEIEGTVWFDHLLDKDAEKGKLEVFQWDIFKGVRTQYESRVRSSSGRAVTLLLENSVVFDDEGEISMVLMVGQDVTRTKRLEDALRERTDRLAEVLEDLSLYNDLMVHDIHNSTAVIQGYLELLAMEGIPQESKKDYIERALSEVKKTSAITRGIKVMSRSRVETGTEPVPVDDVLQCAVSRWGGPVELERSDLHVMADERLEEALFGILENSAPEGRISVEVKRDPARANVVPSPVRLTFLNTGIGRDAARGLSERPSSSKWSSEMLGLYLVRKIISGYNGLVWMEEDGRIDLVLSEAV